MSAFAAFLGSIMSVCYSIFKNYGIAIIIFTLITKVILFPLSVWLHKNSIKMVKMQPEINNIKVRYYGDKDRIADEQSNLYKKEKYNAFASLIPLAIQIALLLGVVNVIYHPITYILRAPAEVTDRFVEVALENNPELDPESNSLELMVIEDIQNPDEGHLSSYTALAQTNPDLPVQPVIEQIRSFNMTFLGLNLSWIASVIGGISIMAPILAAISAWLLSVAENAVNVLQHEESVFSKYGMMAFSVLLSLYLGFYVPSGVALYWVASNLFAILQQYILNAAISPKKYVAYEALEKSRKALEEIQGSKDRKLKGPLAKRVKADYKRFFSIANKHLVFYSESNGFYKYYAGMIEYILKYTNIPIHYITSDPDDSIFEMAKQNDQIKPYYIDSNTLITLMMKMDADIVAMTMPDLETYQIKRSYIRKDIEYINLCHGIGSYNLTFRKGAVDHFDTVFLAGKHQVEEIRKQEAVNHLPAKVLVEDGYPLLDEMIESYSKSEMPEHEKKVVLIAPSWQKGNVVESCLEELLDSLKDKNYHVIVRPHPQHVRHYGDQMKALQVKYQDNPDIEIQTDFTSTSTVFEADIMISDWSSVAYEFAFTTNKPVLFINTPMKVMNPEYKKIDTVPFDIWTRDVVGMSLDPSSIEEAPDKIAYLLENRDKYFDTIEKLKHEYVFNLGSSSEVGARYIINAVFKHIEERRSQSQA